MQVILLLARLVLAGTFAIAGFAKLMDRAGATKALIDFGIPDPLARPVGAILPFLELAVAIALVPVPSAWFGAIAALILLTLFSLAISLNLVLGRRPECNCFGQLHSEPIGWLTLIRNVALAAVGGLVVWQGSVDPGPSIVLWIGELTNSERAGLIGGILALGLLATMVALSLQLLRQQGRLLLRLDAIETRLNGSAAPPVAESRAQPEIGLPLGTNAPTFSLDTSSGQRMTLNALTASGKPTLLLFTNPNCGPCEALLPEAAQWQRQHSQVLTIAFITEGSAKDVKAKIATRVVGPVLLQSEREVAKAYQAWGTPAAVLVGRDGKIASFVAQGAEAIRGLVLQFVGNMRDLDKPAKAPSASGNGQEAHGHGFIRPTSAELGGKAPSLELQDLDGNPQQVASLRGRPTLLLFWNPGCGFCQQMLNDLKAWDAAPAPGAPELLVISSGSEEESRSMNLHARVLLHRGSRVANAFGAGGTPMAILIDGKGHIASEVAGGAKAVLALARGASPA